MPFLSKVLMMSRYSTLAVKIFVVVAFTAVFELALNWLNQWGASSDLKALLRLFCCYLYGYLPHTHVAAFHNFHSG